jgi:hypothetical protein
VRAGDPLPLLFVGVRVRRSLYAQGPSERFSRVPGGPCLNLVRGAPVRMVDVDCSRVEAALQAGKLACPVCFQPLSPWGWGRRRALRTRDGLLSTKPQRSICYACDKTHILLPTVALLRRFDVAEAIGEALALKAAGSGHRRIAAGFGVPATTVRGWQPHVEKYFQGAFSASSSLGSCGARR